MDINHASRGHAVLSPSGAHRWLNCTPSARLELQFPDTSSEAAKEGTLAHEMAEVKLQYYNKAITKRTHTAQLNKLKKNELYQLEMDHHTDSYVDFINREALKFENEPVIKIEVRVDVSEYIPECSGTADCVLIGGGVLHIIDFKYGKGVPVAAKNNEQLTIYALGVYELYKALYDIKTVKLSIVQPRLDNFDTWECSKDALLITGQFIAGKAKLAFAGEGEHVPGDWCRFCRASAQCRARAEENVKLAFQTDKKPPLITNEEVGEYIRMGRDVAKWLSDLEAYALAECLSGREVAGFKAVEGRGSRVWTDEEAAFDKLKANGIEEALLFEPRKHISLAQTEKLVGKKDFGALVGEFVDKKPGKPALVPESDKREAITNIVKASDAFKEDK